MPWVPSLRSDDKNVKILLLEDDPKLGPFLRRVMVEEGFEADLVTTVAEAIALARANATYDLAILDRMLPDGDGLEVCRALRRSGMVVPVLMLTAKGEVRDRVTGLDGGADDYLVKPFDVDELVARVRALTRRGSGLTIYEVGALQVDRVERRATLAGIHLDLSVGDFEMLQLFASAVGETFTAAAVLAGVPALAEGPGPVDVELSVHALREKLGGYGWMIEAVPGGGYRLRATRHG